MSISFDVYTCLEPRFDAEYEPLGLGVGRWVRQADGRSQVLNLLGLSLDWWISILLEHVSHRIPGPADSKIPVPIKVSGLEPSFSPSPYILWPCSG
jgi:hypothetical protein